MNEEIIEIHSLVKGQVQGVGFRATARYTAQGLGLKGSVRNLPNGSVEIYVQGSKKEIDTFFQRLQKNFSMHAISNPVAEIHQYESFDIVF